MLQQDRWILEAIRQNRSRLYRFIRRTVPIEQLRGNPSRGSDRLHDRRIVFATGPMRAPRFLKQ
jgi:hypothetical protein